MTTDTSRAKLIELLRSSEVILNGHFKFGQGLHERHGRVYVNPRAIFRDYSVSIQASQELLAQIDKEIVDQAEVVAGPVTGGVVLARDLSGLISANRDLRKPPVKTVFFEKSYDGLYELTRSDERVVEGKNVLLVDDVRHLNRTFAVCINRLHSAGAKVIATAEIVDRITKGRLPIVQGEPPNFCVGQLPEMELYTRADCPMCGQGVPITKF